MLLLWVQPRQQNPRQFFLCTRRRYIYNRIHLQQWWYYNMFFPLQFLDMLLPPNILKWISLKWFLYPSLFFLTDSYYGGYEGYGNGEWPRGCTDGWKRSSIQCPAFAIYWGNLFFLLYTQFLPLLLTIIVVIFPLLHFCSLLCIVLQSNFHILIGWHIRIC